MPTVSQWHHTLFILSSMAAFPFYWCMVLLNPVTNLKDLVFLIVPTGAMSVWIWIVCRNYLDKYVQLDKI